MGSKFFDKRNQNLVAIKTVFTGQFDDDLRSSRLWRFIETWAEPR